jgi:hypothetical protein
VVWFFFLFLCVFDFEQSGVEQRPFPCSACRGVWVEITVNREHVNFVRASGGVGYLLEVRGCPPPVQQIRQIAKRSVFPFCGLQCLSFQQGKKIMLFSYSTEFGSNMGGQTKCEQKKGF